ncbi:MAG TPA: pyruvate kinase alpha/beta domain-containing protein [Bacillota bacterium]|nr:pyruvate kinase alpha/beta domain-containing protein [Bacillota bacterium]
MNPLDQTSVTLNKALAYAREKSIQYIVVASVSGKTAETLLTYRNNIKVVCVSHVTGFTENGVQEMRPEVRSHLEEGGIPVVTTTHALSGAERGLSTCFGGVYPVEIIAHTLRMFGQGVKVAVEIAVMALDAGTIPFGEKVIAVGGSGKGADSAVLLTPAHAQRILETRIHEVICKPYEF